MNLAKNARGPDARNFFRKYLNESIKEFSSAIKTDEMFADAYIKRGVANFVLSNYGNAYSDFSNAVKIELGLIDGYFMRIMSVCSAFMSFDEMDKYGDYLTTTKNDLDELIRIDSTSAKTICAKAALKLLKDNRDDEYNDILALFKDAVRKDQTLPYVYFIRAAFHYRLFKSENNEDRKAEYGKKVLFDLDIFMQYEYNKPECYELCTDVSLDLKDYERAFQFNKEARTLLPQNLYYKVVSGYILSKMNQLRDAERILHDVSSVDILDFENKSYMTSRFFLMRGRLNNVFFRKEKAKKDFDSALAKAPSLYKKLLEIEIAKEN
ncbi:MAG: hypothetical protein HY606_00580 [Planctomycetes bacterium]|nr:hypothetical protein [Planctomycetota bacterium]